MQESAFSTPVSRRLISMWMIWDFINLIAVEAVHQDDIVYIVDRWLLHL